LPPQNGTLQIPGWAEGWVAHHLQAPVCVSLIMHGAGQPAQLALSLPWQGGAQNEPLIPWTTTATLSTPGPGWPKLHTIVSAALGIVGGL
jgi:hypothetical protein